ncbi:MAG: hypothetical protein LCI00_00315 [Chloroflexi bacterium]|nr:hypothetical protein [Chloroflexota bacterium]MCC6894378.1 hypothetical protein [Anaerolineae bacterium]
MAVIKNRPGWRILAALIFLIGVVIGYFWVHKPLDFALIAGAGGALLDMVSTGLVISVAAGVGRRGLSKIHLAMLSRSERLGLEGLIGLGVLGIVLLVISILALYRPLAMWVILIALAVLNVRFVIAWLGDLRLIFVAALHPVTTWTRFLMIVSALLLVLALLHALAPPYAYDAINYHLVGPQAYLRAGRMITLPDNLFMGFPQTAEIVYGMGMGLFGRDSAAAPLHLSFGVLGLLIVGGLLKRYVDTAAAYLSITLLLTSFSFWLLFGWAYVDLAMFAYGGAVLTLVTIWHSTLLPKTADVDASASPTSNSTTYLILLGVFLGLSVSVKYAAAGLVGAVLLVLLVYSPREFIRNVVIVGLAAGIVFLPWALKGLIYYQNPLYPFIFGGVNWDTGRTATFSTSGFGFLSNGKLWQLPVLPFAASILGVEKGENYGFTAGPWLLTVPFLLLFGWQWLDEKPRTFARLAIVFSLPLLAYWGITALTTNIGSQTRLMLMGFPVAACLAVLGFHSVGKWPRKPLDVGFLSRAILTLTIVFSVTDAVRDTFESKLVPTLLGSTSRAEFLTSKLGVFTAAMDELAKLPEGSQIRFLYESRGYYCPPTQTCLSDVLFDYWPRPLKQGQTIDQVFESWKASGDDYFLVYDLGYTFSATDSRFLTENALFPEAVATYLEPIWTDGIGGYTLYKWK